ncbi:MAG: type II toxin-antitoxin system VapC family toxin [Candidatus Ranarchaeia archaeon]
MLIDTNIFLEVQLGQSKAEQAKRFLRLLKDGVIHGYVTDYTIDSIVILMAHYKKPPRMIRVFLSSLLAYKGLEIYTLSLFDRIAATKHMEELGLDYDDACQLQAMHVLKLKNIVSFDRDFDKIKQIKRIVDISQVEN